LLKQHKELDQTARRILEVNPTHPLIRDRAGKTTQEGIADVAWLLLDQARMVEGEAVPDPAAFAPRLATFVRRGL
jgi:molecular chaperone HtpG